MNSLTIDWGWLMTGTAGFAVGLLVGYVLGVLKASANRVIKIERRIEALELSKNEGGFLRFPIVADILFLLVAGITVWAAFQSQVASNRIQDIQEERSREADCTSAVLFGTVDSLNERTQFTGGQAEANIQLQRSQLRFLTVLAKPNQNPDAANEALAEYLGSLQDFIEIQAKAAGAAEQNPYPTIDEYQSCLREAREE